MDTDPYIAQRSRHPGPTAALPRTTSPGQSGDVDGPSGGSGVGATLPHDPSVPPSLPYEGVNDHGVVIASMRCRGCGYELRGLAMREVCPECRWPVTRSVSGALLVNSPSSHIQRLRLGTTLVIASTLGAFVAAFLGVILSLVLTLATTWADPKMLELVGAGFGAASSGIALWGWWLLSTPDPALAPTEQPSAARRVLRSLTILSLIASVLSLLLQSLDLTGVLPKGPTIAPRLFGTPMSLGSATDVAIDSFLILGGVISLALTSAAMAYLAKIARRIPSPSLETKARRLVWLVWALQPLIGIGSLIAVILVLIAMMRARHALSTVLAQQEAMRLGDR